MRLRHPSARRPAVDRLYTEDARYVDPMAVADGRDIVGFDVAVRDDSGRKSVLGFLDTVPTG